MNQPALSHPGRRHREPLRRLQANRPHRTEWRNHRIDYFPFTTPCCATASGKIVILTRPELELPIREHFDTTLGGGLDLAFAFQNLDDLPAGFSVPAGREKPWGTGHAIWAARHEIDTPFAVINADDFYGARS